MLAPRTRRTPAQPSISTFSVPAPMGGLKSAMAASAMAPTDALMLYNMVASEYGLRVRLGSREWCTGLTGASVDEVRSILTFTGSTASANRVFACTSTGIWDVSSSSAAPTEVLTFAGSSGDSGYGVCHVAVTSAGHFLLYCDEVNGLHVYTESTGLWAAVTMGGGGTQISGADPATFCFVTVFKNRVLFVKKDTGDFYYTAAGSIYGAVTRFSLGTQFRAGGSLVGLWNWTYDGGAGMDDSLVAISSGGDVAIYQGTDPAAAATFGLKGVWYIGATPAGRRIATDFGGDMLILSRTGVIPLSKLVVGGSISSDQYATAAIGPIFNNLMLTRATIKGWSLRLHPEDNSLVVTVPTTEGAVTEQLVMALSNKSWSRYRDLPIFCCEAHEGKMYYGTVDGIVGINDGYVDGVTLADPSSYTPVGWSVMTSFQDLGNARQKKVEMIRPTILADSVSPLYAVHARYKYTFIEVSAPSPGAGALEAWDSAVWDESVWGGEYNASQPVSGAAGTGVDVAIAIRGSSVGRTILVKFDVSFRTGGFL
jgi:hypothetical protein